MSSKEERGVQLEELLRQYLSRVEDGDESALDELCRSHPEHEVAIRARVGVLREAGLLANIEVVDDEVPEQLGDFRIIRRLGGGGMGVVYEAEQTSLGRRVALKLVRPAQLYFRGARARFQREVEAAARLNHSGIVPVHAIGEHEGIPYFAMELVDGESLGEVLERLSGERAEALSGRDLFGASKGGWSEACLRLVMQVADALDHAHSRGVVHRDIKPSNVMLTPDGRAMLVDFGLSNMSGSERITRTGSQMGSLAYMPPEEVDGRAQGTERGARGDVYSLGVSLYELLTLSLPFKGRSSQVTLQKICEASPVSPRKLNRAISRDAETVCLTAMDRDPARRYASARAFATDIRNVLEVRPITVHPAGPGLRLRRWAQRRPGWAAAGILALGGVTLVPLFFFWQQVQALERIGEQKLRAEANLDDALAALDLLTKVGDERLAMVPEASEVRRDLLTGALAFYEKLYDRRRDDPELRLEAARARSRVGQMHFLLGDQKQATEAYQETIEILEAILTNGNEPAVRAVLADAYVEIMPVLTHQGRMDEAEASRVRAQALYRGLVEEGEPLRLAFATSLTQGCVVSRERGESEVAREQLAEAQPVFEELVAENPDDKGETRWLYGLMLNELGRNTPIEGRAAVFDAALAVFEELAEEFQDEKYWFDVSLTGSNAAAARLGLSRVRGGLPSEDTRTRLERAQEVGARLHANHSTVPKYLENLQRVRMNLGVYYYFHKDYDEAFETWEAAREDGEKLVAMDPGDPKLRSNLAVVEMNTASSYYELGRHEEALVSVRRSSEQISLAFPLMPEEFLVRGVMQGTYFLERKIHLQLGDHGLAVEGLENPPAPPDLSDLLSMAGLFASASIVAAGDETLSSAEREATSASYEERAVRWIREAIDQGYDDRPALEQNAALETLRERADFRALLEQLETEPE